MGCPQSGIKVSLPPPPTLFGTFLRPWSRDASCSAGYCRHSSDPGVASHQFHATFGLHTGLGEVNEHKSLQHLHVRSRLRRKLALAQRCHRWNLRTSGVIERGQLCDHRPEVGGATRQKFWVRLAVHATLMDTVLLRADRYGAFHVTLGNRERFRVAF